MTIRQQSIPAFSTAEIEINHCKQIIFEENCVMDMRNLRNIYLNNIGSISFRSRSMNWYGYKERNNGIEQERFDITVPSLKISVFNSNISEISSHAFAGRINEIVFDGVVIERLQPISFANLLQTEKVIIRNAVMKQVGTQAFKSFGTEFFEIVNVQMDVVPSRSISNVTVYQNFTIDNCNFGNVFSGAFSINNPKVFQVTNTHIITLYGEAFKVTSRGMVLFRDNTVRTLNDGAFRGITLRREVLGEPLFVFDSNTFSTLSRYSLTTSDFVVKFRNIYLNETCDCKSIDHKIQDSTYYNDIMCLHENEYVTLHFYKSNLCSVITNYYFTIIIVCIVTVLIIISVAALLLYYKFVYRSKKYGSKEQNKTNTSLSLIVPDGRTYRETELHVILEKKDLLTTDL